MRLQEVSLVSTDYADGRDVAQTSKSAVSRISKSAERDSASTDCRFGNLRYGGGESGPLSRARKGLLERGGRLPRATFARRIIRRVIEMEGPVVCKCVHRHAEARSSAGEMPM